MEIKIIKQFRITSFFKKIKSFFLYNIFGKHVYKYKLNKYSYFLFWIYDKLLGYKYYNFRAGHKANYLNLYKYK